MDKFIIILTLFLYRAPSQCVDSADPPIRFSYNPDSLFGPQNWPRIYTECGKNRQSPINIEVNKLNRGIFKTQLRLEGLDLPIKSVEIRNRALTVHCSFIWENRQPDLFGGPLSSTYLLDSVHFHWGIVNDDGSEHAINGQKCALEAHFVFFNKAYQTSTDAMKYPDGFSVIGVLFNVDSLSPDLHFLNMIKNVTKGGDSIQINAPVINLKELMPKNFVYAHYKGSFTTPPCSQIVDWFVSLEKLTLNPVQLKALREFYDQFVRPISNNFRPLQLTNDRRILMGLMNNK